MLYSLLLKDKEQCINIISGVEINFFDNLPIVQVLSNVYLPEKISTCRKKKVL